MRFFRRRKYSWTPPSNETTNALIIEEAIKRHRKDITASLNANSATRLPAGTRVYANKEQPGYDIVIVGPDDRPLNAAEVNNFIERMSPLNRK